MPRKITSKKPIVRETEFTFYFKLRSIKYVGTVRAEDASHALNLMLRPHLPLSSGGWPVQSPKVRTAGVTSTDYAGPVGELRLASLHKGVSTKNLLPDVLRTMSVENAAKTLRDIEIDYYHHATTDTSALSPVLLDALVEDPTVKDPAHEYEQETKAQDVQSEGDTEAEPLGEPGDEEDPSDAGETGDAGESDQQAAGSVPAPAAGEVFTDGSLGPRAFRIKVGMNVRIWGDVTVTCDSVHDVVAFLSNNPEYVSDHIETEVRLDTDDIDQYNFTQLSLLYASLEETSETYGLEIDVPDDLDSDLAQCDSKSEPARVPDISYLIDLPDFVPIDTYEYSYRGQTMCIEAPAGMSGTDLLAMEGVAEFIRANCEPVDDEIIYIQ